MEKKTESSATISMNWHGTSTYKSSQKHFANISWSEIPEKITELQQVIIKLSGKAVARDIIEVNVFGPDCNDLTLIDLPGIVRALGKDDDPELIKDIESLIAEYLQNERCVVLAVMPANVDYHNSQIIQDAKKYDPEARRTIPVITKPDSIDDGAEGTVLDLLLGKKLDSYAMLHMVKCRGQKDLDNEMSIEAGLNAEISFFNGKEPWKSTIAARSDLFGVNNLSTKLAKKQLQMIKASIPGIQAEIGVKLKQAELALEKLGEVLNTDMERRQFFRNRSDQFLSALRDTFAGNVVCDDGTTFTSVLHDLFKSFNDDIFEHKLGNISTLTVGKKVIVLLDNGTEEAGEIVSMSGDGLYVNVKPEELGKDTATGLLGAAAAEKNAKEIGQHFTHSTRCKLCDDSAKGQACFICVADEFDRHISLFPQRA